MAELLTMASDEFFDGEFDPNECRVIDKIEYLPFKSTEIFKEARMPIRIHSIPKEIEVLACHSDRNDVFFLFDWTEYDLETDVQDAYHGHYAKEKDELEEVDNDWSASFFHATLMYVRDAWDVRQCSHCSCFVDWTDSWEDGERIERLKCPYCDLIDRKDSFIETDTYGKPV